MHKFSLNISSCLFYIRGALPTYHGCGSGFLALCPPDPDTDSEKIADRINTQNTG